MRVNRELLYGGLLEALKKKIPQKSRLASTIAEILMIEKESVYRRLRGDVHFTLCEAWTVAKELGISLDEIGGITTVSNIKPLQMELPLLHKSIDNFNFDVLENFVKQLKNFTDQPSSEFAAALGSLPSSIYSPYRKLTKFFFYKWLYQFGGGEAQKRFEEIELPNRLMKLKKEIEHYTERFSQTTYVWDPIIIENLVNDIKYFSSIRLINGEDVSALKNELLELLEKLETITSEGKYPGTGKDVYFYISNINIGMNYSYISTKSSCMSLFSTFIIQAINSYERETCDKLRNWVTSLKRSSVLISQSGEKERIMFFEKQRSIINTL